MGDKRVGLSTETALFLLTPQIRLTRPQHLHSKINTQLFPELA